MQGRSSTQEIMAWGIMLNHESPDVSNRAQKLFARAKSALSAGSGHTISGISGNDKALACVCLCIVKLNLPTCDHKLVKTSLQRTSGVKPQAFSNALKALSVILQLGSSMNPSPTRQSPTKKKPIQNQSRNATHDCVVDSGRKGKAVTRVIEGSRNSLMKSSPLKRSASIESEGEDDFLLSPTRRKRARVSDNLPSPSKKISLDLHSSRPQPSSKVYESTRTIHRTPLNLPIKKPIKPMCIFQSQPILNLEKHSKPLINFSDWNWKSNLFQSHWSLHDIQEWQKCKLKTIESSLS